jgi:hypothetical protein
MEQNQLWDEDPIVQLQRFRGDLQKMLADNQQDSRQVADRVITAVEIYMQKLSDIQESKLDSKKEMSEILECIQQTVASLNQQARNVNSQFKEIDTQLKFFSKDVETILSQSITRGVEGARVQVDYIALRNYLEKTLVSLNEAAFKIETATDKVNSNIGNTLSHAQQGVNDAIEMYRNNTTPIREFARLKKIIYFSASAFFVLFLIQSGITWHTSADLLSSKHMALVDSSCVWENQAMREFIVSNGAKGKEVKQYIGQKIQEHAEQNRQNLNFFRE